MKEVIVNRIKIKCSKGRIEKGETVILSDAELARICSFRPDAVTIIRDVVEKPEASPVTPKPARKTRNAKSRTLK